VLQLSGFTIGEVSHVHLFSIGRPRDREASDDFDSKMFSVLKLAVSLLATQDMVSWQTSFIQSMTPNQHNTNGRVMDEGLVDGAAWLHKLLQGNTSAVSLFIEKTNKILTVKQLRKRSYNGIPEYCEITCAKLLF
jgi:hypothetical protein